APGIGLVGFTLLIIAYAVIVGIKLKNDKGEVQIGGLWSKKSKQIPILSPTILEGCKDEEETKTRLDKYLDFIYDGFKVFVLKILKNELGIRENHLDTNVDATLALSLLSQATYGQNGHDTVRSII